MDCIPLMDGNFQENGKNRENRRKKGKNAENFWFLAQSE